MGEGRRTAAAGSGTQPKVAPACGVKEGSGSRSRFVGLSGGSFRAVGSFRGMSICWIRALAVVEGMAMSREVQEMFAGIAERYDVTNRVLSAGIHGRWKGRALSLLKPIEGEKLLDVCSGTGDLALALEGIVGRRGRVQGSDFCEPMLRQALKKARKRGVEDSRVHFVAADALRLPYRDGEFDGTVVAFGIRNLDDPVSGLREMARVVRPGGRVVVLEFGQPSFPGFAAFYRWYSRAVMPRIGGWLTGDRGAYEYLPRTAASFPSGRRFLELMEKAGLREVRMVPLSFGIAFAYRGEVKEAVGDAGSA